MEPETREGSQGSQFATWPLSQEYASLSKNGSNDMKKFETSSFFETDNRVK